MQLNSKVYDFFKWLVQLALPAFGTLYFTLSEIWSLPYGEKVVGTATAMALFFGVLIGISKATYLSNGNFDGSIIVDTSDANKDVYSLNLGIPLSELNTKKLITLNVAPKSVLMGDHFDNSGGTA